MFLATVFLELLLLTSRKLQVFINLFYINIPVVETFTGSPTLGDTLQLTRHLRLFDSDILQYVLGWLAVALTQKIFIYTNNIRVIVGQSADIYCLSVCIHNTQLYVLRVII